MSKKPATEAPSSASTDAPVHPVKDADPVKSIEEWARPILEGRTPNGRFHPDLWRFEVASKIHGWSECAHHTGAPFRCTESGFLGAMKAAEGPSYEPHKPALYISTGAK